MGTGNNSSRSNNMKLEHWPLVGGLLHLVQRWGDWVGPQPAQALHHCTKINVTAHPSTVSVPITVLLHNCPLLCGFNVPFKWLINSTKNGTRQKIYTSVPENLSHSKKVEHVGGPLSSTSLVTWQLYNVSKKVNFDNNFGKCGPIFNFWNTVY